jgi:hypothetical protein
MKSKLFTLLMVLLGTFTTAMGQLQKGTVMIGADLANFDIGLDEGSAFVMSISPKAAWFIKDNIALGAYVDFGLATAKDAGETINYGVGALSRYYFSKEDVKIGPTVFFGEANVGIEGVNSAGGNSTNGLGLGFGPGLAYFINPNIALETLLKYKAVIGFGSETTSSRLQLNLGFQIFLPRSKVESEIKKL